LRGELKGGCAGGSSQIWSQRERGAFRVLKTNVRGGRKKDRQRDFGQFGKNTYNCKPGKAGMGIFTKKRKRGREVGKKKPSLGRNTMTHEKEQAERKGWRGCIFAKKDGVVRGVKNTKNNWVEAVDPGRDLEKKVRHLLKGGQWKIRGLSKTVGLNPRFTKKGKGGKKTGTKTTRNSNSKIVMSWSAKGGGKKTWSGRTWCEQDGKKKKGFLGKVWSE